MAYQSECEPTQDDNYWYDIQRACTSANEHSRREYQHQTMPKRPKRRRNARKTPDSLDNCCGERYGGRGEIRDDEYRRRGSDQQRPETRDPYYPLARRHECTCPSRGHDQGVNGYCNQGRGPHHAPQTPPDMPPYRPEYREPRKPREQPRGQPKTRARYPTDDDKAYVTYQRGNKQTGDSYTRRRADGRSDDEHERCNYQPRDPARTCREYEPERRHNRGDVEMRDERYGQQRGQKFLPPRGRRGATRWNLTSMDNYLWVFLSVVALVIVPIWVSGALRLGK